ncbi:PREDICTED: G-box-binding factor 4-like [Tarenaya hassleriana]|uniref:G-box-binding factor 4-like n=1 Tax=Tarenaya hassleriana TaxID=28532 RepID=UPI00053C9E83|nr:PREDICTED: G-box-binding factor 4-like [Tarenaya hassleriana]
MASFKVMPSSNSRNSDLSRRNSSSASSSPTIRSHQLKQDSSADRSRISGGYGGLNDRFGSSMKVDGILRDAYGADPPSSSSVAAAAESTLLDASISLFDDPAPVPVEMAVNVDRSGGGGSDGAMSAAETLGKSVDDVWREIVSGEKKEMKEETQEDIMTLEDFLAKAAVDDAVGTTESEDMDVKIPPERLGGGVYAFDSAPLTPFQMIDKVEGSIVGFGNGLDVYGGGGGRGGARGKRARMIMEPLDKVAAQRQKRMIKNRESAARSRERKQAYQVELESLAAKLEEENEQLWREKAERTKERYKKLMEMAIPVVRKPPVLRRVRSSEW